MFCPVPAGVSRSSSTRRAHIDGGAARPVAGGSPVRIPFDRSRAERQKRLSENEIEIPDMLATQLAALSDVTRTKVL